MKFPFFASFIVFCIWLSFEIRKHRRIQEKASDSFWEKEAAANNTRRKPLDDLNYIHIPFDSLPMDVLKEDPGVAQCHETLYTLSKDPIVNLTGISNTDLKLKYGAPNIDLLSCYDQRYTTLARTLQTWANILYENGFVSEACTVLEFAVETHTDVSSSYKLLSSIYRQNGQIDKIRSLIPIASQLNSVLSGHIVASLEEAIKQ
ncbi:MAG: hypothetical protein J6C64_10435 [Lachnospiraceae bacterium]|nr:hypothetical protein [Lachnospiraceae bacterium]